MSALLTSQIAEQFCDDEESVDLSTFTEIEPEAAGVLAGSFSDLNLDGLTSLDPDVARSLAECEVDLSLNGLSELSDDVAAALSRHVQGGLSCDGISHITDETARMLMRHPGNVSLRRVSGLSARAASLLAFAKSKFSLGCSLPSAPSISDLASQWGFVPESQFLTIAWPFGSQPLFAVGAHHRASDVARVIELIKHSGSFLPPRALLLPEPTNSYDPHAVAVVFPMQQFGEQGRRYGDGIKVGYLQHGTAVRFGEACEKLGLGSSPVEVLACILAGKGPDNAGTIKVNLPNNFLELIVSGYTSEPSSRPSWLASAAPVPKKEVMQNRAKDYTLDEQRKIYCRYAQYKGWNCLPDSVEEKMAAWQNGGLGPVGLAWAFHQDGSDSFQPNDGLSSSPPAHSRPANLREHTIGNIADEDDLVLPQAPKTQAAIGLGKGKPSKGRAIAPERLDAIEVSRNASLKTFFKVWAKWREDVASQATGDFLSESATKITEAGDAIFLERYKVILEEEFEDAQDRADEKTGDRARARVFEQLLERVRRVTELGKWPGIDDAFDDFEIQCDVWAS